MVAGTEPQTVYERWPPSIRVSVSELTNRGKAAALVTGVEAAAAPWIATMDADGQNDPTDLLEMYRLIPDRGRPVLLAGERRRHCDNWLKRLSSRLANGIRSSVLRDGIRDTACGLKLFSADDFLALPRFSGMHRFLPALFLARGIEVVAVPVDDRPRRAGRSKFGFWNRIGAGVVDLLRVAWLKRRLRP